MYLLAIISYYIQTYRYTYKYIYFQGSLRKSACFLYHKHTFAERTFHKYEREKERTRIRIRKKTRKRKYFSATFLDWHFICKQESLKPMIAHQ